MRKKKAVILKPQQVGKCKYVWDALTVGPSIKGESSRSWGICNQDLGNWNHDSNFR